MIATPAIPVAHDPTGVYDIGDSARALLGAPRGGLVFDVPADGEITVD